MLTTTIIIPARYQSTRLPGKPLISLAGKTMLERVVAIAKQAAETIAGVSVVVATDDQRILAHAHSLDVAAVMTPVECASGTDRALAAIQQLNQTPELVINLQGDAPLTPPDFVTALIQSLQQDPQAAMATPVVQLGWHELDELRRFKQQTPFSGTTVIVDPQGYCRWFSKQIIPAIREEDKLRQQHTLSPVYRHIGLYGYRLAALQQLANLSESAYEKLEGLEQCRALENNIAIKAVPVSYQGRPAMSGVDTPLDVERITQLLQQAETACI